MMLNHHQSQLRLKNELKGKLINRIPGSHLFISCLPGSASRMPQDSMSVLEALPAKLDIKRHSFVFSLCVAGCC